MNILSIASILPIPGLKKENDVILRLYAAISAEAPATQFTVIKPLAFPFPLRSLVTNQWLDYLKLYYRGWYETHGFQIHLLPGISFRSPIGLQKYQIESYYQFNKDRLDRWIRDYNIQLIHANRGYSDGYIALQLHKKHGLPYVVTVRNENKYFSHPATAAMVREVVVRANGVTTPSASMADFLTPLCGDRVALIPHGVETSAVVEAENRSQGSNRLLSVCRLLGLKRIEQILQALARLKERYDFHYTLVGEGPERERLLGEVKRLGLTERFTYIPHVPYEQMQDIYANHDVFLLCSFPETFGRVYFEAMAAGLPILCANQYAVNGFFEEGISGFSVDPDDIDAITARIEYYVSQPDRAAMMGSHAREAVRNYTWPLIARKYLQNWSVTPYSPSLSLMQLFPEQGTSS